MADARKINIAIDGYSSCGKSTLARQLAKELSYTYIDSGAMYRAVTLFLLNNEVDLDDVDAVAQTLEAITIDFKYEPETGRKHTYLNGNDVEEAIRTMRVSGKVSEVSKLKIVRERLVALQQEMGHSKGVVMDGRDIGTKVFPDAELKLFMTADFEERVNRRLNELQERQETVDRETVAQNLAHRDSIDTGRKESPLIKADDAREIDNTYLTPEQQLAIAKKYALDIITETAG